MARKTIISMLLAAVVALQLWAQSPTFRTAAEAPVGIRFMGPLSVATGDFNGDGIPDLAVGDYDGAAVEIVLGSGDGKFGPAHATAAGATVRQIALADLDRDGKLDVVAICTDPNIAVMLKGKGDGTFENPVRLEFSARGLAILAADLNGDGIPDLAVGQDRGVSIVFGKGDATFGPATPISLTGEPIAIRGADLNGDGIPDLAIATVDSANYGTGSVLVLLGSVDGTFHPLTPVSVGRPSDLAIGDFNNDHIPDVAIAGRYNSEYYIATGNGDGSMGTPRNFEMKEGALSVAAADFNGDGLTDLVFGNYYGGSVAILLSKGDGTFERLADVLVKGDTYGVVAADLNADGIADVVAANHSSRSVGVAFGLGEGRFQPVLTIGSSADMIATGAYDPEGKPAFAVVNSLADSVVVFRAGLQISESYPVGNTPLRVVTGDFNGDGFADVATLNSGSGDISVLFAKSDGRLEPARRIAAGKNPLSLTVADFNRDGLADLLITFASDDGLLLFSKPGGEFEPAARIPGLAGNRPAAAADFNMDGVADLAVASLSLNAGVQVLLGKGDGTFQRSASFEMDGFPGILLAPDVNGDGKPDLVINLGIAIAVLLSKGDGTFEMPQRTEGPPAGLGASNTMATGDFDGDGKLDVAVSTSRGLQLLSGNGNGSFRSPVPLGVDGRLLSLTTIDWNQDGRVDLAATNAASGTISVFIDSAVQ